MARRPLVAGNWKMNLDLAGAVALAKALVREVDGKDGVHLAVCPPNVYLESVGKVVAGTKIRLGAQNMHSEKKGAFTGEVSAPMLKDFGCTFVILGHSERRHIFRETDAEINDKVYAALEAGLTPIVCVGETLAEREGNKTMRSLAASSTARFPA